MKNLLIYQSTEYDCGPTALTNAIRYLFDREEIYPDIVKYIMLYCLDSYNEAGEVGKRGTSASAMMFLSNWLTQFGQVKNFPISCKQPHCRCLTAGRCCFAACLPGSSSLYSPDRYFGQ